MSSDHFSVDGTLIEAWASIKSFRKKDGGDQDSDGPGRNAERSFHKEKRSNETHESTTDPDARLYKKGDGQPAKLCYMGHALMENRHGLAVLGGVSQATGTAERDEALALVDRRRGRRRRRITLGADKAYDVEAFVLALKDRSVTPHIAIDGHLSKTGKPRRTAIDKRTLRHAGYAVSQRCRKRIEEVFGWIKSSAGFAKIKLRGPRPCRCRLHHGAVGLQSDPPAQAAGSHRMKGKWRITKMPDYDAGFPDMMEPAYILFDGEGGGEFAFRLRHRCHPRSRQHRQRRVLLGRQRRDGRSGR